MPLGVLCLALTAATVQSCVNITGCPVSVGFNSVLDIQLYGGGKQKTKNTLNEVSQVAQSSRFRKSVCGISIKPRLITQQVNHTYRWQMRHRGVD